MAMANHFSKHDEEGEGLLSNIDKSPCMASNRDYHDKPDTIPPRWSPIAPQNRRRLLTWSYLVFLHSAFVIVCWNLVRLHTSSVKCSRLGSFSPAYEAIQTEIRGNRILGHSDASLYSGPPDQENKKAWDSLLLPTYFGISESDLRLTGETIPNSVQLESGNYIAATGAYHELHCIRQIRLYLYKETHYPNLTEPEENYLKGHLDHCLEVLREEVMCTGDTSIVTFFWHEPPRSKPGSKSNAKRTCVDWERFERWSLEHMVPVDAAVRGGSGLRPLWVKEHVEH